MKPLIWTALAAALLSSAGIGFLVLEARGEAARLERRHAELQERLVPFASIEARVLAYQSAKATLENRGAILQTRRAAQASTVSLLSALSEVRDPGIKRLTIRRDGGTLEGEASTPVASIELVERLQAEGRIASFNLDRFSGGKYAVSFTLSPEPVR